MTRDTFVSNVGQEINGNNGSDPRLKVKSIQEMTLVDFAAKSLVGKTIRRAMLHLKVAGTEAIKRVTVSSVGAEWFEGTGSRYAVETGGATFLRRRHSDLSWSVGGGDLCHVVLGNGGTTWRMADASPPDADGWQHVPVGPGIVAARVAGLSYGFLVFDDTGSEWARRGETFTRRIFPNRFVYSRDQNRSSAPYFTIEPGPDDRQPPAAPSGLRVEPRTAVLPAGDAVVSWVTPGDVGPAGTLGFFVMIEDRPLKREMVPLAGAPEARVEMHLRYAMAYAGKTVRLSVRAVDGAGNLGPPATASIRVSDRVPADLPRPVALPGSAGERTGSPVNLPHLAGGEIAIIDELDKVNPITGEMIPAQPEGYLAVNHLWDVKKNQVALHAARNEFVAFQVLWRSQVSVGTLQPRLVFDGPAGGSIKAEFGRYDCVAARGGPLPDPIVPLDDPPSPTASRVQSQSLHVEIYVPHDVGAGAYSGELSLTVRGRSGPQSLRVPVSLRVWDFTLADHLSFLPEMNCYGLPSNERDYYRLAHRHRTVLNRLPYYQNGRVEEGCAPRWDRGRNGFDWSAWDRRFGPLLDGSAFSDLPRKGVPVDCFYLPLHENWPSPMEGNYNGNYWADRAFPESYRQAFVATAREFAAHFQARGWTKTLFQGFLNNKVDFKERGWSRATSPWLLDEPANFQDYWAIRYFARAFHEGINQAWGAATEPRLNSATPSGSLSDRPRMVFRADISRPQWQRDSLDGLLDYLAVNSAMRAYPDLVFERKRALGEIVVEYGGPNAIEGSNVQPAGWERADELSLFYPGRGRGLEAVPIPSIRLKAFRRGQQDVEYLTLWSSLNKEPRWAVGQQVRAALKLAGTRQSTGLGGGEDAGRIEYDRLLPADLWALRVALGEALSQARPAPSRKLVDFRTPRRDLSHLPATFVGE